MQNVLKERANLHFFKLDTMFKFGNLNHGLLFLALLKFLKENFNYKI